LWRDFSGDVPNFSKNHVINLHISLETASSERYNAMPRVTITVPDQTSQPYRFQLDRKIVTIGRGSDNDIVVECGSVSTKHAEMARISGGYEMRDIGSTNGIKLAGNRAQIIRLESDMTVHLGDVAFHFLLSDEELEALRKEQPVVESPIIAEQPLPALPRTTHAQEKKIPTPRQTEERSAPKKTGGSFWIIFAFIALAAISFYVGLSIRHKKITGSSLMDSIQTNLSGDPAPPAQ